MNKVVQRAGTMSRQVLLARRTLFLFVLAGVLLAHGYQFPSTNHALEIPPILKLLEPGLFEQDFFVREMLRFTPRIYYLYGMAFLAEMGLGVTLAYGLTYLVALGVTLMGLYAIARPIAPSRFIAVVFVFWAFTASAGLIGEATLWPQAPIPTAYAMCLAVWGLVFSLRRTWIAAYACFGMACLLQFLVGVLPAVLVGPMYLLDVWRRRQWRRAALAVAVAVLGAGLVYVPMVVQGTTATGLFTDREFVAIYGVWRHPHHMIPSSWPQTEWVQLLFFYAGGMLCLLQTRTLAVAIRAGLLTVIGLTLAGLLANYLFVEVWPSALVVQLQFSRMTPFAELAMLAGLAALCYEQWKARRYALCVLLLVLPVSHVPGLFLGAFALMLPWLERVAMRMWQPPYRWLTICLAIVIYRWPVDASPVYWAKAFLEGPLLLLVLVSPLLVQRWIARHWQPVVAAGLLVSVAGAIAVATSGILPAQIDRLVAEQVTVRGVWNDEIAVLARRFSDRSPHDALVLVPPGVQHFRLLARRSVVVDFKAFPFTEQGIAEWAERMRAVQACDGQPPSCLMAVAHRYGAGYVLTEGGRRLPDANPVDQEGEWILWQLDTQEDVSKESVVDRP